MKRAHHPDQKAVRRQAILDAAARMLEVHDFQALRMADLAQELGLAKGTLYTYFPTKESLFLALLAQHMDGWFAAAGRALGALAAPSDPRAVAQALTAHLSAHPLLPRLMAILHTVLEQNLPVEDVIAFKRFLLQGVEALAPRLASRLPGIPPERSLQALLRLHALVVGFQSMAQRPPAVDAALQEPDLAILALDFMPTLEQTFADLLTGMSRS